MKVLHPLALVLFVASATAQAQAQAQAPKDAMSSMQMPAPNRRAAGALTDAVVQKVDTAGGLLVLKHGDIPNLGMPGMTMGFDVADRKMLQAVKAGDKVRFHVEIMKGKPTVTQLEAAR